MNSSPQEWMKKMNYSFDIFGPTKDTKQRKLFDMFFKAFKQDLVFGGLSSGHGE